MKFEQVFVRSGLGLPLWEPLQVRNETGFENLYVIEENTMACPAFGSTSEQSLWYALDTNPAVDIATSGTATWHEVPYTGESLTANLSSTVSDRITAQRSYAGSKLSQGEVSGDINFEAHASEFVMNMIVAALQANQNLGFGGAPLAGPGPTISAAGAAPADPRTIDLTGVTFLAGAQYRIIIGPNVFSHVPSSGTISGVATALAAAINAHATYTATASSNIITISSGAGTSNISYTGYSLGGGWPAGTALVNGSTKKCLMFMKRILVGAGKYDYYIYRGCQVGSISFEGTPGALVTGTINVMGLRPQAPIANTAIPGTWTFVPAPSGQLMSGADSLKDFSISVGGVDSGVVMQSVTLSINNNLRQQQAVGLGHPFAAGVASGRIQVTFGGSAYYADPTIYNQFVNDTPLKIEGKLLDSNLVGFGFLADFVKVTTGGAPMAGGADQDLVIETEFQAYESASNGTIKITRLGVPV